MVKLFKYFYIFIFLFLSLHISSQLNKRSSVSHGENICYNKLINPFQSSESEKIRMKIVQDAKKYLGIKYRNSGSNPKTGFDCSGFTKYIFRKKGISLNSSAPGQSKYGRWVSTKSADQGDLAFFGYRRSNGKLSITHTGIVISKPGSPLSFIHSSSKRGIMITELNKDPYWKKNFLFVKSIIH